MFGLFRNRRRRKLLAEPFSPYWKAILKRNVGHHSHISPALQSRLRDLTRIFIAEKSFEGCGGLHITEEIKVTIAGQAALLVLGRDIDDYGRVPTIIVYPDEIQSPNEEDGWEDDHLSERFIEGQAVYRGPVILSWKFVLEEGRNPLEIGHNVVLHEFAHQLDFLDRATDGTPILDSREMEQRWSVVMTAAFEKHQQELERGDDTFFSEQAGDSPTEFFADATEAYYCRPHDLFADEPGVYELLKAYYKVDPREWFASD